MEQVCKIEVKTIQYACQARPTFVVCVCVYLPLCFTKKSEVTNKLVITFYFGLACFNGLAD